MKKYVILLLILITLLSGCGNNNSTSDTISTSSKFAINFVDDDGRTITMEKPAQKIISMYSAHTENLYTLGVGDKIIGGYKTCVYPASAAFLPTYDYKSDPEKIIAAEPDLVLIRPFITKKSPDFINTLLNAGINVVSLYPDNYDEFDDYITKLGLLTGSEEVAKKALKSQKELINETNNKVKDISEKQTIFFESTETNLRTVTTNSMAGKAILLAGGINIANNVSPISKGSSIAAFGAENILANADNIDVYVSQRGSMNAGGNLKSILARPGFDTIKAVKNKRVFIINEKIMSSPTFRYYKGVKELARFLYPDIIDNIDNYKNNSITTRRDFANILVKSNHIPIYLPSSSRYYTKNISGHYFGTFNDVDFLDPDFDYIETAVISGLISSYKEGVNENSNEMEKKLGFVEYFKPEQEITRYELAKAIMLLSNFSSKKEHLEINDLDSCPNKRLVQLLVDNNIFKLENGNFNPNRPVTNNEILNILTTL